MFAIILMYIIILFSIIGLTFCIENIWLFILHPKSSPKRSIIIELEKNIAKLQIIEIAEELKWKGENKINKIYITNNNIDPDTFLSLKNEFENDKIIFVKNLEINNWTP